MCNSAVSDIESDPPTASDLSVELYEFISNEELNIDNRYIDNKK